MHRIWTAAVQGTVMLTVWSLVQPGRAQYTEFPAADPATPAPVDSAGTGTGVEAGTTDGTTPPPADSADDVFAMESAQDVAEDDMDEPFGFDEEGGDRFFETRLYGYIDSYWEKVADTPAGVDGAGQTVFESNPHEFDVLNLHLMVQGTVASRFRYFLNLAGPGSGSPTSDEAIGVRNAWVEASIYGDYLNLRFGKTYRRFGLYNEILDAVPTFIGIEAPELFDRDHLMLTRTTNLMVHGAATAGRHSVTYSIATGNDEREDDEVPLGLDVFYDYGSLFRVGTSFYSTIGDAVPSRGVGEGSPRGGVVNWMDQDSYYVFGAYAQLTLDRFLGQVAYWQANHDAQRNPAATASLLGESLNQRQIRRFFTDPAMAAAIADTGNFSDAEALVRRTVEYSVQTFYARAGYEVPISDTAAITPYGQVDYYRNPETINSKDAGGDAEAGLSDNGRFWKVTAGAILRPIPPVALKIDASAHIQTFNDETVTYPEIRASLSYLWELEY